VSAVRATIICKRVNQRNQFDLFLRSVFSIVFFPFSIASAINSGGRGVVEAGVRKLLCCYCGQNWREKEAIRYVGWFSC
jgi:hypothetical protein